MPIAIDKQASSHHSAIFFFGGMPACLDLWSVCGLWFISCLFTDEPRSLASCSALLHRRWRANISESMMRVGCGANRQNLTLGMNRMREPNALGCFNRTVIISGFVEPL